MAGYSKKSLVEKLGIKPDIKLVVFNSPGDYQKLLDEEAKGVELSKQLTPQSPFIHFFTKRQKELTEKFPELKKNLSFNGILWISWPKQSAKIKTDLNEGIVQKIGLENGLVDVKVTAIDNTWSGLKFVYRIKDRL
ncbi:DUF3052 domain-containing protein [Candidatus Daviesbacteria bacterium]|nr:DUF3052 domain-containing protein [Candidatus Daviesbacteria bacterium]